MSLNSLPLHVLLAIAYTPCKSLCANKLVLTEKNKMTQTKREIQTEPATPKQNARIEVADALRGIAVVGIILFHAVECFNIFYQDVRFSWPCDDGVYFVCQQLLSGKMYGIFALLFGFTFFIMRDNQSRRGRDFSGRFAWRMVLLFLIGMANIAVYDGDILTTYALCALVLIPCGYLSNRWLWVVAVVLFVQPYELWQWLSGSRMESDWIWSSYAMLSQHHQQSTFWQNVVANVQYAFPANLGYFAWTGRLTQIPALFLLGLLLGRYRLLCNEGRHLRLWKTVLWVSVPLALTGMVLLASLPEPASFTPVAAWLQPVTNLATMMAETAAVVLAWYASARFRRLLAPVCTFGRMSLSNYLLQSLLGCMLFYGWGFAIYRQLGHTCSLLIGVAIVAVQLIVSCLWARRYARGPAESLWRIATWRPFAQKR